jgi:hypothetical protein
MKRTARRIKVDCPSCQGHKEAIVLKSAQQPVFDDDGSICNVVDFLFIQCVEDSCSLLGLMEVVPDEDGNLMRETYVRAYPSTDLEA